MVATENRAPRRLRHKLSHAIRVTAIVLFLESTCLGETKTEFLNNVMYQSGYGGKQVYDGSGNQRLFVYEPELFIDQKISPETSLNAKGLYDIWSGASDHIFDVNTGASKRPSDSTEREHIAFDLGVLTTLEKVNLAPTVGYSTSTTYESFHGGFGIDRGFAEDNFTPSLNYMHYQDSERTFDYQAKMLAGSNPRNTDTVFLGASQILTRSDIVYAGLGYTSQRGMLSTVGNTVDLGRTRVNEILPGSRNKFVVYLRGVHGFSDFLAAHVDYRFYSDDWGISAHSLETSLAVENELETALLRLFYRYHTQTATQYYADAFPSQQTFMTSDSDLAQFQANEIGAQGSLQLEVEWFKKFELGGSLVYYVRTNDLNFTLVQLSVLGEF